MFDDLDKDTKKILIVALIGGLAGLSVALMVKSREKESSSEMGKIIADLSGVMETTKKGKSFVKKIEREVGSHEDLIHSAIDLAAAGINLWKQFKKTG